MTHHHLEGFAEAVLRAGGDHNIRVVPDPGVRLVNCLLEVTKLLQEARMTISGEILESRGQVRPTEVNGGSVGHTDRDVGDGEHGGVGEAAGERGIISLEAAARILVISLIREGWRAADTALMNREYIAAPLCHNGGSSVSQWPPKNIFLGAFVT